MAGVLLATLVATACSIPEKKTLEYTNHGPSADDLFVARSYALNGRKPTFDERRRWENEMEERVYGYLRQHPELEQTARYTDFRSWWQIAPGSTPAEVRLLLDEPQEQTVDPARMAALAERHWPEVESKAKEAWVYDPGWIVYFDDKGVIIMLHRVTTSILGD